MGDGITLSSSSTRNTRRCATGLARTPVRVLVSTAAVAVLISRMLRRVEVAGDSMLPVLAPGDRLLVLRHPRWRWHVGQLAALHDPRRPDAALLVKRVAAVTAGGVDVRGDNPAASTDSRAFGPVRPGLMVGPVLYRYWPPERAGRPGGARVREETAGTLGL